jgi:hypothetical protein
MAFNKGFMVIQGGLSENSRLQSVINEARWFPLFKKNLSIMICHLSDLQVIGKRASWGC